MTRRKRITRRTRRVTRRRRSTPRRRGVTTRRAGRRRTSPESPGDPSQGLTRAGSTRKGARRRWEFLRAAPQALQRHLAGLRGPRSEALSRGGAATSQGLSGKEQGSPARLPTIPMKAMRARQVLGPGSLDPKTDPGSARSARAKSHAEAVDVTGLFGGHAAALS